MMSMPSTSLSCLQLVMGPWHLWNLKLKDDQLATGAYLSLIAHDEGHLRVHASGSQVSSTRERIPLDHGIAVGDCHLPPKVEPMRHLHHPQQPALSTMTQHFGIRLHSPAVWRCAPVSKESSFQKPLPDGPGVQIQCGRMEIIGASVILRGKEIPVQSFQSCVFSYVFL